MIIYFKLIKDACYYDDSRVNSIVSLSTTLYFLDDGNRRLALERLMMCVNR